MPKLVGRGEAVQFMHSDHDDTHASREFMTGEDVERNLHTVLVNRVGDRTMLDPDLLVDINL